MKIVTGLIFLCATASFAELETTYTEVQRFAGGADGALMQSADGFIYGTIPGGGTNNAGFVFRYQPSGSFSVLYNFTGGNDGAGAKAALTDGPDENLYGVTGGGGALGNGTVFKLSRAGVLTTLHAFNGSEGFRPETRLMLASDGDLYGTCNWEGTYRIDSLGGFAKISNAGNYALAEGNDHNYYSSDTVNIFHISPSGMKTPVYRLNGNTDGDWSWASLLRGWDGNFYGTASEGGAYGAGTVFRVTPAGQFKVLHDFEGYSDGDYPAAPLIQGHDGNFYGSTMFGGVNSAGTVFQLTPDGIHTKLFDLPGGPYGNSIQSSLVEGLDGRFYGLEAGSDTIFFQLSVTLNTSGSECVSLDCTNLVIRVDGGSTNTNVKADDSCRWFVVNTNDFIIITSDGSGRGEGTVPFSVAPNNSLTERTGIIGINGNEVVVRQRGYDGFGNYAGLFSDTNAPAAARSGRVFLTLEKTGAFTGQLSVDGTPATLLGQFNSGFATNSVFIAGVSLQIILRIDTAGGILGEVTDGAFVSELSTILGPYNSSNSCPWLGHYRFLLEPGASSYHGYGFGTLTVSITGNCQFTGIFGDGTALNAAALVSSNGTIPFYSDDGTGISWASVSTNSLAESTMQWFTSNGSVSSLQIAPEGTAFPGGTGTITLSGGELFNASITKNIAVDSRGKVIVAPRGSDRLKLKINPVTGEFHGSFLNPTYRKRYKIGGLLIPSGRIGGGYYTRPALTYAGAVRIDLAP